MLYLCLLFECNYRKLDIRIMVKVIKYGLVMIMLGLGLHCSGNPQRWRNGGVLSAGEIWKNVQVISTTWRHGAGRQVPMQWQCCCRLKCCAPRLYSVSVGLGLVDEI